MRQWQAPRNHDAVWLIYSASYLLHAGGVKWAVDPVLPDNRIPEAPELEVTSDLSDLELVLLSHAHQDHRDVRLWSQLAPSGCHWIVPDHMLADFTSHVAMRNVSHSVAVAGRELNIAGLRIVPFLSPHHERRSMELINPVASTGYLVETKNKSFLFPGDIRTYDPTYIRPFVGVTAVFAHVFLGRSAALMPAPPLLQAFTEFFLACRPRRILLTHLYEFGRDPVDCWQTSHARMAAAALRARGRKVKISVPSWYREFSL